MRKVKFEKLLREWWERYLSRGNLRYALECWRVLEREVIPVIGQLDPNRIKPPIVLGILRNVESKGTYAKARKIKSHISQAMRYGIACGLAASDPTRDIGFALTRYKPRPRAAITDPKEIGSLMLKIERHNFRQRRLSLKLAALTFVRAGELTSAEWSEIKWDDNLWRIPAAKMKMKRPHLVPLAGQTVDALRELRELVGDCPWLFPSRWDKARHENANVLTLALRSLGYPRDKICAHGFRAMAATSLSDMGWPSEVIERQLAHVDSNRVRAAYQRSELMEERRRMMQAWADFPDLKCARAILGR